jgi:hypothetical protein
MPLIGKGAVAPPGRRLRYMVKDVDGLREPLNSAAGTRLLKVAQVSQDVAGAASAN